MSSPFDYVYITGSTSSSNLPTTPGMFQPSYRGSGDAFVAKLNAAGSGPTSFVYTTYLGGSGNDNALDITVDNGKNLYVIGYTSSSDFPLANALQSAYGGAGDALVVELNPSATGALYSSFLVEVSADVRQPRHGFS